MDFLFSNKKPVIKVKKSVKKRSTLKLKRKQPTRKLQKGGSFLWMIYYKSEKAARYMADLALQAFTSVQSDKEIQKYLRKTLISFFEKFYKEYKNDVISNRTSTKQTNVSYKTIDEIFNIKMIKTASGSYQPESKSDNYIRSIEFIVKKFIYFLSKSIQNANTYEQLADGKDKRPYTYKKDGDKFPVTTFYDKFSSITVENIFSKLANPDVDSSNADTKKKLMRKDRYNTIKNFRNNMSNYITAMSYLIKYFNNTGYSENNS